MKFDITHSIAAVALFAIVYMVGKKQGAKTNATGPGPGQPGNAITQQSEWWTYAGQWN